MGEQNRYGLVWAFMLNPAELPINDEPQICLGIYADALKQAQMYKRAPRVATSTNETGS